MEITINNILQWTFDLFMVFHFSTISRTSERANEQKSQRMSVKHCNGTQCSHMLRIWHKLKITSNERRRQNRLRTSYPFFWTSFLFGVLFYTFSFFCNAFGIECVAVLRKFAHAWKHSTELFTKTIVCYAIIGFSCWNFSLFFLCCSKGEAQIAIFLHSRCNFCISYIGNWRLRFEHAF